jgi:hypothetical protein
MADYATIWLEPKDHSGEEGRTWCHEDVWGTCDECGALPTKYVRADRFEMLVSLAQLFEQAVEYQIKVDLANGDDEGARMKTATLNQIRTALESVRETA